MRRANVLTLLLLMLCLVAASGAPRGAAILCIAPGGHVAVETPALTCASAAEHGLASTRDPSRVVPAGPHAPDVADCVADECQGCTDIPLDGIRFEASRIHSSTQHATLAAPGATSAIGVDLDVLHATVARCNAARHARARPSPAHQRSVILRI